MTRVADDAAFTQHLPDLRAAALKLAASEHEAEDLVQDCLASAVQGIGRLRNAGVLGAWLHQILRRRWYDLIRRRTADRKLLREAEPQMPRDTGDEIVRRALDQLDPDSRRVLQLRFFEGRNSVEIGVKLGKPAGTVRSMIFHALRKFEAEFKQLCPKENA